jgi:hypothetical protein
MRTPTTGFELFLAMVANGCVLRMKGNELKIADREKFLTDPFRQLIRQHRDELIALLTATRVDKNAVCPVSPTGQHQWYELTSGVQKCLSCLTPMDETPAHMEPVAVNDAHAIDAA